MPESASAGATQSTKTRATDADAVVEVMTQPFELWTLATSGVRLAAAHRWLVLGARWHDRTGDAISLDEIERILI